ncbi:SDR family NAD(P)-dependent oxidoreductase [Rhodoblastus acidophilus]|jgi:short-subunit dehydrogenase|uniref:SDR family NAD(P)-dependent oxidoreductase n=1 Tax=Rhodoblastus acidophilus TaxID=1074 RepID=A0A6N8DHE2_RHOAC|nr:SDR family NAD(P)-dependent oxidoreductase [Rhodoblastus acidophilus]MCW2272616.1 short-subunit dehydrogenase [Rhodoblastus acidophilus]MTV29528.1 SDR family NAD(P)-dependent oxidoreductase [Rhodoblastus acidophilus]
MPSARSIAITGASGGLGRALALSYAAPGVTLHLLGRSETRLVETAALARQRGAETRTAALDVRDSSAMAAFLREGDARAAIDCLIGNAGVTWGSRPDGELEDFAGIRGVMEINFGGALNSFLPLIDSMLRRGRGQIGLVSSIAAFAPQADCAGYAASKAALLALALSLRAALSPHGLRVNAICPGFVDTPMAARYIGWKPSMVSAEYAAQLIQRGLARDKAIIAFPRGLYLAARLQQILPESLRRVGMDRFRFHVRPETE